MFNIIELIDERRHFPIDESLDPFKGEYYAYALNRRQNGDIALLTTISILNNKRKMKSFWEHYHVAGVYKLGQIFANKRTNFYILHLSEYIPQGFKIAFYKGKPYHQKKSNSENGDMDNNMYVVPESYTEEWMGYIRKVEHWMNSYDIPENTDLYEFNFLRKPNDDCYLPEKYSHELIELRELLNKQGINPLNAFADMLTPDTGDPGDFSKILNVWDLKYPLNVDSLETGISTNVQLSYGDIVIPRIRSKVKAYLFDYKGRERICASTDLLVIRCSYIRPEYLYYYLNSETALKVLNAQNTKKFFFRITPNNVSNLPIGIVNNEIENYLKEYFALEHTEIKNYSQLFLLNQYYQDISEVAKSKALLTVNDIFDSEIANLIKKYKESSLRSLISDDLNELNKCFNVKAYKATLILAGSVLEAVLIDWFSEIKKKNYFKKHYYVYDEKGRKKRADLFDYIEKIKEIKDPEWDREAEKAHSIREKRNLVHAKVCLKSEEKIDENACRKAISDLEDILMTRDMSSGK